MDTNNVLETELQFYRQEKDKILKPYWGQFVLIKGEELVGAYTSAKEAYKVGVEKFGQDPFLIKKVSEDEEEVSYPALSLGIINAVF